MLLKSSAPVAEYRSPDVQQEKQQKKKQSGAVGNGAEHDAPPSTHATAFLHVSSHRHTKVRLLPNMTASRDKRGCLELQQMKGSVTEEEENR